MNKRSLFLPHSSSIMSMEAGYVYPALVREMYPNDSIVISHEMLLKAAPMLFTPYSPVKLYVDYFFNENRNVWRGDESKDWSTFFTGSVDGKAVTDPDDLPVHPYIEVPEGGFKTGSLADYLGFSTEPFLAGAQLSALRFRHYQMICKNFYLDENFSTMPTIALTEGLDTTTSMDLQKCCWNKDRFTTASLSPQKGIGVDVPLAGTIPVYVASNGSYNMAGQSDGLYNVTTVSSGGSFNLTTGVGKVSPLPDGAYSSWGTPNNDTSSNAQSQLYGDLSDATGISVDDLHFLVQVERLNQRDNFWGSRDFECIRTQFGISVPDTRLQRPTCLGRSVVDVHFSEVLQTSQSTDGNDGSAQGTITGHTMAVSQSRPVRFRCREHGFLFVMVRIMPIAQYQQGVPRDALYKTRYDYMWPILSQTGEQEVFSAEVYATKDNIQSRKIFGYEPRYNHLRFGEKTVHGDFRTNLSGYHMGRIFTSEPNLGENFVTADPTKRMFAVELPDTQPWWLRCEFNIKHVRRLPKWPTPDSIGRIF